MRGNKVILLIMPLIIYVKNWENKVINSYSSSIDSFNVCYIGGYDTQDLP